MCEEFIMNSKEYWDNRFREDSDNSWVGRSGIGQTNYFAEIMIDNLPDYIYKELSENSYKIIDFGCALGQLCSLFSEVFDNYNIVGVDLSDEAVKQAKKMYPWLNFTSKEITIKDECDVLVTSNTLEHLEHWQAYMKLFTHIAKKYIIVLVPQESGIFDEHVVEFNTESFPETINNFVKISQQTIQCDNDEYWNAKQLLVVYENAENK